MDIVDIDRVVVASDDLERTTNVLAERLGLTFGETLDVVAETDAGDVPVRSAISRSTATSLDVVEPAGDGNGDGDDESDGGPFASFLEERGTAMYALAVRVVDVEQARAELREQGVEPVGTIEDGDFVEYFYHPREFDGLLVYLAEHPHPYEMANRHERA